MASQKPNPTYVACGSSRGRYYGVRTIRIIGIGSTKRRKFLVFWIDYQKNQDVCKNDTWIFSPKADEFALTPDMI